jgi:TnpA family transposase
MPPEEKPKIYACQALRTAIADVSNAIFVIRQPHIWGEGTAACASDSKKFSASESLFTGVRTDARWAKRGRLCILLLAEL